MSGAATTAGSRGAERTQIEAEADSVREQAFPWDEAISAGLGVLRLSPREFWAMTPRELAGAMQVFRPLRAGMPPSRRALEALMRQFPDQQTD